MDRFWGAQLGELEGLLVWGASCAGGRWLEHIRQGKGMSVAGWGCWRFQNLFLQPAPVSQAPSALSPGPDSRPQTIQLLLPFSFISLLSLRSWTNDRAVGSYCFLYPSFESQHWAAFSRKGSWISVCADVSTVLRIRTRLSVTLSLSVPTKPLSE